MKGKNFPYRIYHGLHCPIVPLEITGPSGTVITEAYVDSGAFYSIFSSNVAIGLGLAYKKVSSSPITNQLALKIIELTQDKEKRQRFAQKAYQDVCDRFSDTRMAERYKEVYCSVLY